MSLMPARMKRVNIVVLQRDTRRVTVLLGQLGVLHLVEVQPEAAAVPVTRTGRTAALEESRGLLSRLAALREKLRLERLPPAREDSHEAISDVAAQVAAIERLTTPLLDQRAKVETESSEIHDELARLDTLGILSVPLSRVVESPYLHFAIGVIRASDLKRLAEEVRTDTVLLDAPGTQDRLRLIAITSRKGRFALETQLKQHNFARTDVASAPKGVPVEIVAGLERRLQEIRQEQARISQRLRELAETEGAHISNLYRRLELEAAILTASMNFGHTASTSLISGWIPEDSIAIVSSRLLEATQEHVIIDVRDAMESGASPEDVPVLMRNNRFVRPFQVLVSGFGFPQYNEVEPTLLVALSFILMYALMFGDLGHGIVLAIIGLVLRQKSSEAHMRDIGTILVYVGTAAAITGGVLYGSVFGKDILPYVWVRPLEEVGTLVAMPIFLGVALVSLGVILNIINRFRNRDYFHGVFDRFGVVGIVFYWGSLGLALRYILSSGSKVGILPILALIVLPLALLFFRDIIGQWFMRRQNHSDEGALVWMHGAVGLMETVAGYLANTVSFARIGAFALAHAGLCLAIFKLEDMVGSGAAGTILSVLIVVVGNAVVIVLEGLIVFVQCLRLEYYEFFGKFFQGQGKRYDPFRIG